MIALLLALSAIVTSAWCFACVVLLLSKTHGRAYPALARAIFHELRPLFLPAAATVYVTDAIGEGTFIDGMRIFGFACQIFIWVYYRKFDDDDRWKRRAKRLAEKVEAAGHRLTVVPVGGESR